MLTELKVADFVSELASNKPAPGGGSASALAGALAAALAKMVAQLSEGQSEIAARAEVLVNQLLHLVNRDTQAFNQVMAAFKLPKGTDEEKQARREQIQAATRLAAEVPLQIMKFALQALELAREMALHGNKNCLSDAGVAGLLAATACRGAAYNVLINLPGLKDEEFVDNARAQVQEMLSRVQELDARIADYVTTALS